MRKKYPDLEIKAFETWYNKENANLMSLFLKAHGIPSSGVPVTFVGDRSPVHGFGSAETTGAEIEGLINYCRVVGCADPISRVTGAVPPPSASQDVPSVDLPIAGKVDPRSMALPILTIVLGGLDGFNPCAFYVLFMLLSMLVHAQSRARMLLIGGTFVFFSGLIYFLFMAAWLNVFILAGSVAYLTTIAGAVAVVIAVLNIKDYFYFKKGVSLTIPESAKPKLFDRMRGLLKASSLSSMFFGTVVLAVAANSYELLCTVGFPMVFTKILTMNKLSQGTYYLYLAAYNVVYVIPLATIVVIFSVTLGSRKLTERQGRILKLVSGVMMLFLGGMLVFKPALLNNVGAAVGLLVAALGTAWAIVYLRGDKEPAPAKAGHKKK